MTINETAVLVEQALKKAGLESRVYNAHPAPGLEHGTEIRMEVAVFAIKPNKD